MADISGKDLAYRALASALGGPVDLATMAMRPFGYSVEKPILGSEWIGQKMEQGGLISEARDPLKEFAASIAVPSPTGLAASLSKGAAVVPALAGMTKMGKAEDALGKMMRASGPDKLIPIKEVFNLPMTDLPMASFLKGSKPKDAFVPVKKIAPTQSEIHSEGLLEKIMDQAEGASLKDARTGTYPEAVKMGDEYILLDGHHRIAAQIAQGKENVPVHVIGEIAPSKVVPGPSGLAAGISKGAQQALEE